MGILFLWLFAGDGFGKKLAMTSRSRHYTLILLALAVLALLGTAGCRRRAHNGVNVMGSTSIQPFAEMLADEFNNSHASSRIDVQGGGSTMGIQSVTNSLAEIAMCSRGLKVSESAHLTPVVIALDGMAVVVHHDNPVSNLTREQVRELFNGTVTNWKQLGGEDRPVRLITREEGSGTREAFAKLVMDNQRICRKALTQESNGAVKELVRADRSAIGYMSLGLVHGDAKILDIDGVTPSMENVRNETYPLVRPFLFVVQSEKKLSSSAQEFMDFVLSPEGQEMLVKEGLVSVL